MTEYEILKAVGEGESGDWEFKAAREGFPRSVWETYSGMANTDGGVIVLGVKEDDDGWEVIGLPNPDQTRRTFWNAVHNPQAVSVCLVSDRHVRLVEIGEHTVLAIEVPRATRQQRPVYRGSNPLTGTYRRNHEGDYVCNPDEVKRMLAEQSGQSLDAAILEDFDMDDLDSESLRQYRQQFADVRSTHAWQGLDDQAFLAKIGGWRSDRQTDEEGLTLAALLLFGTDEAIRDPAGVPGFQLDYREKLSDDPGVRWTDRLTQDGTWVGNIFQFLNKVLGRLLDDLKLPFAINEDGVRREDPIVHEAVREALVNTLIHADYEGQGGVVVEKYRDGFQFSNPGRLLLSIAQILEGGVSECRNKNLQKMLYMVGYGERAGSGWNTIQQGWLSQKWRSPRISETQHPDRVNVELPTTSLMPEEALERLRERFGDAIDDLDGEEMQALVTAETEGEVSNSRLQQLSMQHPADLTTLLQGLVEQGLLRQEGQKRGTVYKLARPGGPLILSEEELAEVVDVAASPGSANPAMVERIREVILLVCDGRYLTASQIAELLKREPLSVEKRFLQPMVEENLLSLRYDEETVKDGQMYTRVRGDEE